MIPFSLSIVFSQIEQVGSGISRIRIALKDSGLPMAEFNTEGLFSVVFKRTSKSTDDKTENIKEKTRDKIISLIVNNENITTSELANAIGITDKGIEYHIGILTDKGAFKRIGSKKTGSWIVIGKK